RRETAPRKHHGIACDGQRPSRDPFRDFGAIEHQAYLHLLPRRRKRRQTPDRARLRLQRSAMFLSTSSRLLVLKTIVRRVLGPGPRASMLRDLFSPLTRRVTGI